MLKKLSVYGIITTIVLSSFGVQAAWNETKKTEQQTVLLNKIESKVKESKDAVVIFDLDSTLFKNHERWAAIVREYGELKKIEKLKSFKKEQISDSWDMMGILGKDSGMGQEFASKNIEDFKNFWGQRFFNDEYVKHDEVLPGSVEYVNRLYKDGAHIVYITGRNAPDMKIGTLAKLKAEGFPIGLAKTELIMKPMSNADLKKQTKNKDEYAKLINKTDDDFKAGALSKARSYGSVVASFDNAPTHINLYYNAFHKSGDGWAVFLDTDHTPKAPKVLKGVIGINGFLR